MAHDLVAVSPHLDDLALSCGRLLASRPGSLMVTVFAGGPGHVDPLPDWDKESGAFKPGDDVVGRRRQEDIEAAEVLGAATHHLEFWDWHYRDPIHRYDGPTTRADLSEAVATELRSLIDRLQAATWLIPLGLIHPDHRVTARACLAIAERHPTIEWLVYDDLPYALEFAPDIDRAVSDLATQGLELEPDTHLESSPHQSVKREALHRYRSQCPALGDRVEASITASERIRHLTRGRGG